MFEVIMHISDTNDLFRALGKMTTHYRVINTHEMQSDQGQKHAEPFCPRQDDDEEQPSNSRHVKRKPGAKTHHHPNGLKSEQNALAFIKSQAKPCSKQAVINELVRQGYSPLTGGVAVSKLMADMLIRKTPANLYVPVQQKAKRQAK